MKYSDKIFQIALKTIIDERPRGTQRQLSLKTGINSTHLNYILKGKNYGTEETHRKLAEELGYPGVKYEEFLDVGRLQLGLEPLVQKNYFEIKLGPKTSQDLELILNNQEEHLILKTFIEFLADKIKKGPQT